jgi:hypothetical protein
MRRRRLVRLTLRTHYAWRALLRAAGLEKEGAPTAIGGRLDAYGREGRR